MGEGIWDPVHLPGEKPIYWCTLDEMHRSQWNYNNVISWILRGKSVGRGKDSSINHTSAACLAHLI